jgi:hypothetical protein
VYQRAPWSEKAYEAAQGQICPHQGLQEGYYLDTKTGDTFPAPPRPVLAVYCPECMGGYQTAVDKEAEVKDLKKRIARLEAARDQ